MLRVGCGVHVCLYAHVGLHKAGPRGGQVSSHVLANIGGLFFLPSEVHIGASGVIAAIITYLITTQLGCESHGRNLDDMGPSSMMRG